MAEERAEGGGWGVGGPKEGWGERWRVGVGFVGVVLLGLGGVDGDGVFVVGSRVWNVSFVRVGGRFVLALGMLDLSMGTCGVGLA